MPYRTDEILNKSSLAEGDERHRQKEGEVIQWLNLNKCFVLYNNDGRIIFSINGKTCMIYLKETDRPVSGRLRTELKNYNNYKIKAKAIYSIYDMDEFLGDTT